MDDALKHALEIVRAQAGFRTMSEEEMSSMVRTLHAAICEIENRDTDAVVQVPEAGAKQISEKSVTCLECGKSFKLITRRHLMSHGLSAEEYREKWGYPKDTPLVCKGLQRERRRKMKDMRLWEKRRKDAGNA
ncbi:MucR family transcriptional regulator [Desulfovibrio sp. OttesenSCG-928-A18]|nr:MucR family transcriptional regulator [Desulfovibrio sp. OttesenSCG-928-A18]